MKEDEDVVERSAEFVDQDLELGRNISEQGYDAFFGDYETFTRKEYDVVVQLERFGVACCIESA